MQPIAKGARALPAILLAAVLVSPSVAEDARGVPEPAGLWTGVLKGETPATLEGATVIGVEELEEMLESGQPVLIDVGLADRKPEGLADTAVWLPTHRSIPGASWFPGAGPGDLPQERADALLARVTELTEGDKAKPVVTFCQPQCWGSWNVGKRLVQAGYTSVHWLPDGVSGWQERNDTVVVDPESGWLAKPPAD